VNKQTAREDDSNDPDDAAPLPIELQLQQVQQSLTAQLDKQFVLIESLSARLESAGNTSVPLCLLFCTSVSVWVHIYVPGICVT